MRPVVVRMTTRLNIGGPARQALLLTRALRDRFDTVLAAGDAPRHEGELSAPDIDVTRVPLTRSVNPLKDVRAWRAVRRLMVEKRPALVHTHMAKAGAIGRSVAARMYPRPAIVHTFHGHVLDGYFPAPQRAAFIAAERFLARRTDALIAVGEGVRDELLDLGIGDASRWHVLPVGLDLEPFLAARRTGRWRQRLGISDDAIVIGSLGRLTAIKDHVSLIEAVAKVPHVHLVLFGDGEERPRIEAAARDRGIEERVHMPGWTDDVPAAVVDLDVVALTSVKEGTPVSLIEASAAGRPVVATDVGSVTDVVIPDVTGLLTAPHDPSATARALGYLVEHPSRRKEMGERGRAHVSARFGSHRLISDIHALYASLLS